MKCISDDVIPIYNKMVEVVSFRPPHSHSHSANNGIFCVCTTCPPIEIEKMQQTMERTKLFRAIEKKSKSGLNVELEVALVLLYLYTYINSFRLQSRTKY